MDIVGDLYINGLNKDTNFVVSGKITPETLEAEGFSEIKLSDFNIEPPSLAGLFTTDNLVAISFSTIAK